jgi:transcriptional regulator with XRE-family HTH domain
MTSNFNELFLKMKPSSQARVKSRSDELLRTMALADVRRAQARTQQQLAGTLNVNQAWISRVERQTDMYLSTLRGYIEALGGELELVARFTNCAVRLDQFAEAQAVPLDDSQPPPLDLLASREEADARRQGPEEVERDAQHPHDPSRSVFPIGSATDIWRLAASKRERPSRMHLYGGGVYPAVEHASVTSDFSRRVRSTFHRADRTSRQRLAGVDQSVVLSVVLSTDSVGESAAHMDNRDVSAAA